MHLKYCCLQLTILTRVGFMVHLYGDTKLHIQMVHALQYLLCMHTHTHMHKYSGYWHGSVHVHMRTAREVQDFDYFLEEVATLSCIRHENIQLFMGVCLDMTGGTLAIMMRCVMLLLVLSVPPDLCTHWIVHSQKLNLGNKSMADCTPILLYKVTDVYL